jgi:hypothetical protein
MTVREQAHREAMKLPLATIAERLQDILGQQITSYAIGVKDPRSVGKYARGDVTRPKHETDRRLRQLYVVTQVLSTRETAETVRAWMVGAHPLLEDKAPVELLHGEMYPPVERTAAAEAAEGAEARTGYQSVIDAAEAFVGSR